MVSIFLPFPKTPLSPILSELKSTPFIEKTHLDLARSYRKIGNFARVNQELDLARIQDNNSVLGEMTDTSVFEDAWFDPKKLQTQQAFWQTIAQTYPLYRDAYVQLLYIAYNSGDKTQIQTYLTKITSLDPNYSANLPPELRGD